MFLTIVIYFVRSKFTNTLSYTFKNEEMLIIKKINKKLPHRKVLLRQYSQL